MQLARSKTYNRYDVYLFLIILSALYGRYGLIHPSSFFSICFLPELLRCRTLLFSKKTKGVSVFLILWFSYAAISMLWSPNNHDAFLEVFLVLFNSILFMEIVAFSMKANHPLQTLALAWVCAFLLTSIVAIWEIFTDHHLQSAKEIKDYRKNELGDYMDKHYAAFTFYNPNTYCYYICLAFPFALYLFSQAKRKVVYFIPILLSVYVMSQNSSRGGTITLAIMLCTFVYFKMKGSSIGVKVHIIIAIGILGLILILYGKILFQGLFFRLSSSGLFEDNARLILWYASWQEFLNSNGFGMGAGSMVPILEASKNNMISAYLSYSHCMVLEILLEYGVFFGLGIVFFLIKLVRLGIKVRDYRLKALVLGVVFSFPFYSVINSDNMKLSFIWMFFATVFVFAIFSGNKIGRDISESRIRMK